MRLGFKHVEEDARYKLFENSGLYISQKNGSPQQDIELNKVIVFKDRDTQIYYYLIDGVVYYKSSDDVFRLLPKHHQERWFDIITRLGGTPAV